MTGNPAGDTEWIKTVSVQSALLESFWGRPMRLEACVLLPWGFDSHPDARYPLLVAHGHYSAVFGPGGGFRTTPPSPNASGCGCGRSRAPVPPDGYRRVLKASVGAHLRVEVRCAPERASDAHAELCAQV